MRPPLNSYKTQGNALFLILIGVALFAALSYAVTRSSGGGGNIDTEKAQLDAALSQQCNAYIERGLNMLEVVGGCEASRISYELPDGTNANPQAPADKSCHLFDPAGAGLTPCGIYAGTCTDAQLADLSVGERCINIVYAGESGGNRIYTTMSDQSAGTLWDNTGTTMVATSPSDGLTNTNDILAAFPAVDAPLMCRNLGPEWYLPATNELIKLYENKEVIGGFDDTSGIRYWTSREYSNPGAWAVRFTDGNAHYYTKYNYTFNVRCVRR